MAAVEQDLAYMDLYSRQIGAFGVETMRNLLSLDVLVVGLRGTGAEAAKNLILAGPRAVVLYDPVPVAPADLGANCFLTAASIGKPCAAECVQALAVLNPYVKVSVLEGQLADETLRRFGVVVCADATMGGAAMRRLGELCRTAGAALIVGLATGVFGTVFTDFGAQHVVTDGDGEAARVNMIKELDIAVEDAAQSKVSVVVTVADDSHELSDEDLVQFADVDGEGVGVLNDLGPVQIRRIYVTYDSGRRQKLVANKFALSLTPEQAAGIVAMAHKVSQFKYRANGVATEVKRRVPLAFRPLAESAVNPLLDGAMYLQHPDASKMYAGRGSQLHLARLAIWEFADKHAGQMPRLHSAEDAAECVAIAEQFAAANRELGAEKALVVEQVDASVVRRCALYCRAELAGLATFVGGVIAQEVVKRFGKYTPIRQWLHLDYLELVPEEGLPADCEPRGTRYDAQIAVIGRAAHEKLANQRWFMVGCGALGCEYLKGFALMGLGTQQGQIFVTDMDRIEVSNLNRQFLFRRENVGQQKSVTAARAAQVMNPDMHIRCFETRVGPETEDIFDDEFWLSLDGACNALDNVIARRYVDSRCVFFERPLLESGTLGTKANSEIVIPHKTASYSENKDPEVGNAIPMCTLRNFPYIIDHAIEWGRAQFTEVFEAPARDASQYITDRAAFMKALEKEGNATAQLEKLNAVKRVLLTAAHAVTHGFKACIQLAAEEFQRQFHARIRDLTHSFPEDSRAKDPNTGAEILFWSGTKRFPRHASLDFADPMHIDYLFATANLYAFMYGIPQVQDRAEFAKMLAENPPAVQPWAPPKEAVCTLEEDGGTAEQSASSGRDADTAALQAIFAEIDRAVDPKTMRPLQAAEFEKDDDTNFHIDFITACSNMRAWNYHIKPAPRHQIKMVAGRIIPAIATTTAMITGLVCLEMYKLVLGLPKDKFYASNVNLATSTFEFFEPDNPKPAKPSYDVIEMTNTVPVPDGFTVWDRVIVDIGPDATIQQFVDAFPSIHHGCTCSYLIKADILPEDIKAGRDKPLFSSFCVTQSLTDLVEKNKSRPLREVFFEIYGPPPKGRKFLILDGSFETPSGDTAKIPPIRFIFAH